METGFVAAGHIIMVNLHSTRNSAARGFGSIARATLCAVFVVLSGSGLLVLQPRAQVASVPASSGSGLLVQQPRAQITSVPASSGRGWSSADHLAIKTIGDVQISADGHRIAYTLQSNERAGRASAQLWAWDAATGTAARVGGDKATGSHPRWSPDGKWLAYLGRADDESGLALVKMDGSPATFLARVVSTNHPLPSTGDVFAWSSGSSRIAYVSGVPGPESDEANGDPMVISRYLYKPTASEGLSRFNDNRRLQLWVVDLVTREPRQVSDGTDYRHSLAWSPDGDQILFVANAESDPDRVFNYDVFAMAVAGGSVRQITRTKSAEYMPAWSPDSTQIAMLATTRPLTSSETTMEDTHVWVMKADGSNRRDIGSMVDNRQGAPRWSGDGKWVYFTVEERGSTNLYRLAPSGGPAERIAPEPGDRSSITSWSIAKNGTLAFAAVAPGAPGELFIQPPGERPRRLTTINDDLVRSRATQQVEAFTFKSADGTEVEAFLTQPAGWKPTGKHPLIVMIHGGPHGQQGPAFNLKAQAYASRGWASLMVNYRGSTGYGQRFADAIARDQNGAEASDVLAGVDAALARYPWIDATRLGIEGGSYGGQLTNWMITRTDRFKAAVSLAGISNLVSFNYTAYYHDYLAVEFGAYPHEAGVMEALWERSPLRYAGRVKTPTLLLHGENDNDVPIAEAEQWYIALKDVGVDTVMVRYPREGHGLREPKHVVDSIDRSIAWYDRHFAAPAPAARPKR
ncbi:MAG: S9 family peptidase [Acidobacteriota bacterium]